MLNFKRCISLLLILCQKATVEYCLPEQERCRPPNSWGFNRGGGNGILRMMGREILTLQLFLPCIQLRLKQGKAKEGCRVDVSKGKKNTTGVYYITHHYI